MSRGSTPTIAENHPGESAGTPAVTSPAMKGLMQDVPLTITHVFDRAERYFPHKTRDHGQRLGQAADALRGVGRADPPPRWGARRPRASRPTGGWRRSAWNTGRHLELYFAAPCTGRVLHTLNIRLFPEQLTYIVNHADDEVIFVDRSLLASARSAAAHVRAPPSPRGDGRRQGRLPDDLERARAARLRGAAGRRPPAEFAVDDEDRAASMCYTSGTTGNPKGVVYSHRSTFLHTMAAMTADSLGARRDRPRPPGRADVPRQRLGPGPRRRGRGRRPGHAGPDLSGAGDRRPHRRRARSPSPPACRRSGCGVLPLLEGRDTSSLRAIPCGGSAVPKALSEATASSSACRSCRPGG